MHRGTIYKYIFLLVLTKKSKLSLQTLHLNAQQKLD